ncbi:MAG: hypothetical protein JO303_02765 [Caulobacteraceae bacterium]|nr:hypothetical protein [Caulobacteraceae bacterium]
MSRLKRFRAPASSRLSYPEFLDARLVLREAGVPPRVASALANAGVTSLEDLRARPWDGREGLREQLAQARHVGQSTLTEIERWRLSPSLGRAAKTRPAVTWEARPEVGPGRVRRAKA